MVVNKRRKVTKYRGHTTHGGGAGKKRRGSGNRGGVGRAGSGKRAQSKKQMFEKLGRFGFTPHGINERKEVKAVNVGDLERLIKKNKIEEKEGFYFLDLSSLGYQKLLGAGKTNLKLKVKAERWSKQAEEKIKAGGGERVQGVGKEGEEKKGEE